MSGGHSQENEHRPLCYALGSHRRLRLLHIFVLAAVENEPDRKGCSQSNSIALRLLEGCRYFNLLYPWIFRRFKIKTNS